MATPPFVGTDATTATGPRGALPESEFLRVDPGAGSGAPMK
ncbi:hypothetical protein [Streptomyces oryzae]|nr:hypothetical protein [Streptomyces oryzae]